MTERNEWADRDKRWMLIDERKFMWHPQQIGNIAGSIGLGPGMTVADIGCGLGYLGRTYWEYFGRGGRYIGVDCSDSLLEEAAGLAEEWAVGGSVQFLNASAYGIPLPDASVDVAMCQTLMIHLEHPERALAEMVRITRPGGTVMCKESNILSQRMKLDYSNAISGDIDEMLLLRKMRLLWHRGRRELGKGYMGIAPLLPRMMSRAGLEEIGGVFNQRMQILQPPYEKPEQQLRLKALRDQFINDSPSTEEEKKQSRDDYRRHYVAGGGDPSEFDDDYDHLVEVVQREQEKRNRQVEEGTLYYCPGGNTYACIYGRKPHISSISGGRRSLSEELVDQGKGVRSKPAEKGREEA